MERLQALYRTRFGKEADSIAPLPGSGSHRRYFRLTGGDATVIGVIGTDPEENKAFLTEARHFRSKGIPVPEILAVAPDGRLFPCAQDAPYRLRRSSGGLCRCGVGRRLLLEGHVRHGL